MIRFLKSLFFLTLACLFQACSHIPAPDKDPIFLWRLTHPQKLPGKSLFIYGTIRAQPKDLAYLNRSVIDSIEKSDRVYVNYDPALVESFELMSWLGKEGILPQSVFLKDRISKDVYARLETVMDKKQFKGDYRENIKKMPAWRAAFVLQNYTMESWGMAESYGSESQVVALTMEKNKPIAGLLDAMAQFKLYASVSPKDQEIHLEKIINGLLEGGAGSAFRNSEEDSRQVTEIYSQGDLQKLDAFIGSVATDPKSQDFFKSVISDGNKDVVQKIEKLAEEKPTTFVGVDVFYLAGPGNILDTLRKDGFVVERVPPQGKVDRIFYQGSAPSQKGSIRLDLG